MSQGSKVNRNRTRNQEKVLTLLEKLGRSLSAQELYLELRQHDQPMGLATVYRALDSLKLEGQLKARLLPSGETVYSPNHSDRHYLTCLQCGASVQIEDCPVHDLEEKLRQSQAFEIYYHNLEFFGRCAACHGGNT